MFIILCNFQDTVVLGKNAQHSFGRTQDRALPPTLNLKRMTIEAQEKGDEFGNEDQKQGTPAKRMTIDALSERARKQKRLDPKILSVKKRLDSKDVNVN